MDMPRGNANVTVVQNTGRGTVTVVQQPSSWNNYTTVIRIQDPQGGYGYYDFRPDVAVTKFRCSRSRRFRDSRCTNKRTTAA